MKIPQLQMESVYARIGIHKENAKLEIEQELPKVHIEQPQVEISIQTRPGKLTIDQSKAFEEMDLMSILRRNDMHAEESLRALKEAIGKKAREGKELMQIEHGKNVIAEQAKRRVNPPPKQLGIKFIPSHFSVKINYEPAEVEFDVKTEKPRIEAEFHPPQFTYHPGRMETYLAQRNELNITVIEP